MEIKKLIINDDYIRLDAALKLAGVVSTGGQAKILIQGGIIKVNNQVCPMRGKKLANGDRIDWNGGAMIIIHAD